MPSDPFAFFLFASFIGAFLGASLLFIYNKISLKTYQDLAKELIKKATQEAEEIKLKTDLKLKSQQLEHQKNLEAYTAVERRKLEREEERLKTKEDKLEMRTGLLEKKLFEVEKQQALFSVKEEKIAEEKKLLEKEKAKAGEMLQKLSALSLSEAKKYLLELAENELKTDKANLIRRTLKEAEEEAEKKASQIIATAINRLASPCVSEMAVNTIAIPSDDMKGRIIGREGRNIRALEQATGVNFVIDDTPGAIVLSGYDPIRIQVAKMTLSELMSDGRIYPTRIEEVVEKAKVNIKKRIVQHGEDAALRAGIMNLHPEIVVLLGKLKFRYSYGQNILEHSLEVSHLMGLMASELGLDTALAKRIGLLHDMGKAVSHEIEGSHATVGHDLALKYGESLDVATGIGCHHREMASSTIEGSLCSAADAISASRPGARIEAVEEYVKRLKKLETMALSFPGVDKAYAMQAGREVRVIVLPDVLDDSGAVCLARDLTKQIEDQLKYPGKIKVTVVREKRAVEYAM